MPPGALVAPKDPLEYWNKLRFLPEVRGPGAYGLVDRRGGPSAMSKEGHDQGRHDQEQEHDGRDLHRRRPAGQSRPGRGARSCAIAASRRSCPAARRRPPTTAWRDGDDRRVGGPEAAVQGAADPDSQYLRDGITKWIHGWKKRGWVTASKTPVKNVDLWRRLEALALEPHELAWHWVRGHAGHRENERVDDIARRAIGKVGSAQPADRGPAVRGPAVEGGGRGSAERLEDLLGAGDVEPPGFSSTSSVLTTPSSTTMA